MATLDVSSGDAVPEALQRSLADLLRQQLEPTGAGDIAIYADADYAGNPVVLVRVKHRLVDRPIEVKELIEAERAARDLAWQQGERRFVLINHVWDERQKVAGAR
jgi:hypothetical protein